MVANIFVGLLCISIGLIFARFGYALSMITLPILAFFTGLFMVLLLFNDGLIATILGLAVGTGLGWLAYFFLFARMIMAGATLALSLTTTFMGALGFTVEAIAFVATPAAVILGVVALLPFLRKHASIAATSTAAASLITVGVLFLLPGLIQPGRASVGSVFVAFRQSPPIVFLIWIPVAGLSMFFQHRVFKDAKNLEDVEEELS